MISKSYSWRKNSCFWKLSNIKKGFSSSENLYQVKNLLTLPKSHCIETKKQDILTIQTSFLRNKTNPKIKHKTICKKIREGDQKNVDIRNKWTSFQKSWAKRLYDDCFPAWETILLYLLGKTFGPSFKFHSNLSFKKSTLKKLPPFYKC